MSNSNIETVKRFLVDYLRGRVCEYEVIHPWRKGWEFVIQHSLRVEAYAVKIINGEKHGLSDKEIENIRMAAVLHDIGRMENRENHAAYGAEIVKGWFAKNTEISANLEDKEKIIYMIEQHSNKEGFDPDLGSGILKDADTLDEIGVMSIFMASNRIDRESPFFFSQLLDRVKKFETDFCDKKMDKLNTDTAKELLKEKKDFIKLFISQLENELDGNGINELEQLI